jgi:hypothetical protein
MNSFENNRNFLGLIRKYEDEKRMLLKMKYEDENEKYFRRRGRE